MAVQHETIEFAAEPDPQPFAQAGELAASAGISSEAIRQASPKPTIKGTGSVPLRRRCSCPPPCNSGSIENPRPTATTKEDAHAFRPIQLVSAGTQQVDGKIRQVKRQLADRLNGIGMEQHAPLAAQFTDFADWVERPDLVVCENDGDKHGVRPRTALATSSGLTRACESTLRNVTSVPVRARRRNGSRPTDVRRRW